MTPTFLTAATILALIAVKTFLDALDDGPWSFPGRPAQRGNQRFQNNRDGLGLGHEALTIEAEAKHHVA